MTDRRHAAFNTAFQIITRSGLDRLAAPITGGLGAILMLHHVAPHVERAFNPNALLSITPEYLDQVLQLVREKGVDIVSLDEAGRRLRAAEGGRRFISITFDDGYRDNLDHALPVLRKHQAPFTLYAVPGFAEGTSELWWLDMEEAIALLDRFEVDIDGKVRTFDVSTNALKHAAWAKVYWHLRRGPEEELRAFCHALAQKAGLDPDARTRSLCLDWEGLRKIASDPLCTIGAHTMTHVMLAKSTPRAAEMEMAESRSVLEDKLQREVKHFAYPVGDPGSAGHREFAVAKTLGFESAVTTRPGMLFAGHRDHMLALPRLSVNGFHQNQRAMQALLSGLPFALLNRGRKLNTG
jgi:peptidoglycan/xylan/chitin deacetylase (PgdA/CDA1 family)